MSEKEEVTSTEATQEETGEKPIQVVSITDHKFEIHEEALQSILLRPNVAGKKVCVISVAGAFRKGKSFLLDFFLRFFKSKGIAGWQGEEDAPLKGFSWRGGSERETTGIWIWSEPYLARTRDGEDIAVLIMDTQGTFDTHSTVLENVTIFGLSTLLSSTQVYNLSQSVKEDDLQHLQLFTEYGRLISEGCEGADTSVAPFQKLRFLVRDWQNQTEYDFGATGGKKYLDSILNISDNQHEDLKMVREHISTSFEELDCFLMPHPGFDVTENPKYNGCLATVRLVFKDQLIALVESTAKPTSLIVKQVNGKPITCKELLTYFVIYMKIFQDEELPQPKTALAATAEAININAKDDALQFYETTMDNSTQGSYLLPQQLTKLHTDTQAHSLQMYRGAKKMGSKTVIEQYENELKQRIEQSFERVKTLNQAKGNLSSLKTPISLLCCVIIAYILSHAWLDWLLINLGFSFVATLLDVTYYILLLLLIGYIIITLIGAEHDLAKQGKRHVDAAAGIVWDAGLSNFAASVRNKALEVGQSAIIAGASKPKLE